MSEPAHEPEPAHDRHPPTLGRPAWRAFARGLVLLGGLVLASCPGGGAEPATPDEPPTVLARARRYPPALQYKLDLLDPARDVWECEVFAGLAEDVFARLAARLAAGEPVDAAWSAGVAAPGFASPIAGRGPARTVRDTPPFTVRRSDLRRAAGEAAAGPPAFARALAVLLEPFDGARGVRLRAEIDRADREGVTESSGFRTEAAVELFGRASDGARLQQCARWSCRWQRDGDGARLTALDVLELEEVLGPADGAPLFEDCTRSALGAEPTYEAFVLHGIPYWNASLDKALDTAIFGHTGIAVGDADGDGLEDLYVCQAGGLPNQLFLHAADGTARDRAPALGVDVCDFTRSALFADFDADGDQDLVLATSQALVVFANEGGARFRRALSMPITGTALATADADGDGLLDLYVCRYSRPESLWPVPYHDANNGPSNVLLKNEGGLRFRVATEELGLDVSNRRYSFAAGWLDYDGDGDQDLYVANDFGRNVLYVNDGKRFRELTAAAGAEDVAAGMSVAWGDYDQDGAPDLYVANMDSSAGRRLAHQPGFRGGRPSTAAYQRHARGNTLLRNRGDGTFEDRSVEAGVALGRWAWGSSFVDVDNDGRLDLAVANGYLSNGTPDVLCSYFWRQVVGLSPEGPDEVVTAYEDGWIALSELQRELTFNGDEPNCLFLNTGGARFADVSAVSGFDHPDDGRALCVVDWDGDGALDVWVSARSAPRLRLLRNTNPSGHRSVSVLLADRGSNRDAIGARVELLREPGAPRLVRFVVAGDGFLSQSTRWLHFGLGPDPATAGGDRHGAAQALVTWPDGERETFDGLAANGRFLLTRGRGHAVPAARPKVPSALRASEPVLPSQTAAALVRLAAPLPLLGLEALDRHSKPVSLAPRNGRPACIFLWGASSAASLGALATLERRARELQNAGIDVLALGIEAAADRAGAAALLGARGVSLELAFATEDLLDTLDLQLAAVLEQPPPWLLPSALLLDGDGRLVALLRGRIDPDVVLAELGRGELEPEARRALATPFPGTWLAPPAERSLQALAAVLRRHGRLELAAAYLSLALPDGSAADLDPGAVQGLADAQELLGRELLSKHRFAEAAEAFAACLALDATRAAVEVELGNALRGLERPDDAFRHYRAALELDRESPDAHYSVGLMHALAERFDEAQRSFAEAVRLAPERPLAHFNLGVSLANLRRLDEAAQSVARSLELDPAYLPATLTLAAIHDRRGDARAALAIYRAGLERHPGEPRLAYGLGRTFVALGDRAAAEATRVELARHDADLAARLAREIAEMP